MQEGGPVAIEKWAEVHKDAFKPPICNKVSSSVCLCTVMTTSLAPLSSCEENPVKRCDAAHAIFSMGVAVCLVYQCLQAFPCAKS